MIQDIITPVYFLEKDNGKKVVDEDCMREEFEYKLEKAIKLVEEESVDVAASI